MTRPISMSCTVRMPAHMHSLAVCLKVPASRPVSWPLADCAVWSLKRRSHVSQVLRYSPLWSYATCFAEFIVVHDEKMYWTNASFTVRDDLIKHQRIMCSPILPPTGFGQWPPASLIRPCWHSANERPLSTEWAWLKWTSGEKGRSGAKLSKTYYLSSELVQ